MSQTSWAVVVPMANEEADFFSFTNALKSQLDKIPGGQVYLIVDKASTDRTPELCKELASNDRRFFFVWAPENKNVVDAYLRGYREAFKANVSFVIEMDAGNSHDPSSLNNFVELLSSGNYKAVYGSRFIMGGKMVDSPFKRIFLSKAGTFLTNLLLGTSLHDMTSGYQGFQKDIVKKFLDYNLHSKAHFYQTELRYLLRKYPSIEIPISYKSPSPRVSAGSVRNSIDTLLFYFWRRITFRPISL